MPPPDDLSSLRDIEHCAAQILDWTAGMSEAEFLRNSLVQSAVYRQLAIIGEAARRISEPFQSAHVEIMWKSWIDFRNVLVHAYDGIDDVRVWAVVANEIEGLRAAAVGLMDDLLRGRKPA